MDLDSSSSDDEASKPCTGAHLWANLSVYHATVTITISYLFFGLVIYANEENWTNTVSIYFCVVTMSTVGYGDYSPTTWGMQTFTVIWILVGIVGVFGGLTAVVSRILGPITQKGRDALEHLFPMTHVDIDGNGESDYKIPRSAPIYYAKNMLPSVLIALTLQLISAGIFAAVEPSWDFGLAFYHCMVTATTVGYGDVKIETHRGMVWACFHIVLSVCLIGEVLSSYDRLSDERERMLRRTEHLKKQLDPDLVHRLKIRAKMLRRSAMSIAQEAFEEPDGGLSELEFALATLIEIEVVSWDTVKPFLKRFHKLDADNNGFLDKDDISMLLESKKLNKTVGELGASAVQPSSQPAPEHADTEGVRSLAHAWSMLTSDLPADSDGKSCCLRAMQPLNTLLLTALYLCIGTAVYSHAEGWTFIECLYFNVVTMSTVGYGDFSPTTDGTRAFTVFWIIIGIAVVFARLGQAVTPILSPLTAKGRDLLELWFPMGSVDMDGNGQIEYKIPRSPPIYYSKNLLPDCLLILILQLISAAIFVAIEPSWDFGIALYHCFVTATTVGYGDVTIETDAGKIWACVHIILSVCVLGGVISNIDRLREERANLLIRIKNLRRAVSPDLFDNLLEHVLEIRPPKSQKTKMENEEGEQGLRSEVQKTGGRKDEALTGLEFVVGMLLELHLLEIEDVKPLLKKFRELKKNNDERLNHEDAKCQAKPHTGVAVQLGRANITSTSFSI